MRARSWVVLAWMLQGCSSGVESPTASNAATQQDEAGAPQLDVRRGSEREPEPEPEPPRAILAAHVENARDLGGIVLPEQRKVASGLLFRGPPLANLTEQGCAAVSELGIRSVIDLRVESEVALKPDAACVLSEAQLVAAPLPVPYNVSAADYIAVLDANASVLRAFQALGDRANYPVYFHCTWGRDRTGILAAVVLLALGATPEAVMEDYLVSDETVGAFPASLRAALDEIARRGGIDAYLGAVGVTAQQLTTLRSHAVDIAP